MNEVVFAVLFEAALIIFLMFVLVYAVYSLYAMASFAPYVHSGKRKILSMLEIAEIAEGMEILDLGSGNGDLCILAAKRGVKAVGIEINPLLVWWSRFKAKRNGVSEKTQFIRTDLWRYRFPAGTRAVFVYGMPEKMGPLWKKLQAELPQGVSVVSHAFTFPEETPEKADGNVRLYKI